MIRTLTATRYAVPLREGGSLPAVLEVSDGESSELFVTKFKGAGQGARALVAELIVAQLAMLLELAVPEPALIDVHESFGRTERDPEIQDILKGSTGLNVGLKFLDGAFNFNPLAGADLISAETAADIVWLDALTTNIDRTARNPNLMVHERRTFLIDHGAALFFHHNWEGLTDARTQGEFDQIREHVLLPIAGDINDADARLANRCTNSAIETILDAVPDELLMFAPAGTEPPFKTPTANREAYRSYFERRLTAPRRFADAANAHRLSTQSSSPPSLPYRR